MKTRIRLFASLLLLTGWIACDKPTPVAPAEATLTITANPTRIDVNGSATITVLARKASGTAVNPGTEINFSTDLGSIDPVAMTDQRGVAEATLRGDGRIGMATVTINSGAAMQEEITVQIGALASSITLSANKRSVNKDVPPGGVKIKLEAQVFDDLNNTIRGVSVVFESPVGTFEEGGSVTTNLNGKAKNVLVIKDDVRNFTTFTITASTAPDEGVTEEEVTAAVDIDVSGFAFDILLTVTPTSIPLTGGVIRLAALVIDDFGDAADGENVSFETSLGSLASGGGLIPTDAGGQAFDSLTVTEADLASLGDGTGITVNARVFTFGDEEDPIVSDDFVIALQVDEPIAGFDVTTVDGLEVTFTNTTTGDPTPTFEWSFGDGTISNAAGTTVTYTYADAGTYTVTLTATNVGGSDTFSNDVTVVTEPDIVVTPASLSFGGVKAGTSATLGVTVFNNGSADLTVDDVKISGSDFSIVASPDPFTLTPGTSQSITVGFSPAPPPGTSGTTRTGTLAIESNDPDEGTVIVNLTGIGNPP